MSFLLRLLDRCFGHKVIVNCDRDPYLVRWYLIRRDRFALFLHRFVRSDEDRALHDHPWDFIVIPIWRGYIEHSDRENPVTGMRTPMQARVWPIIGTRLRPAEYRHRVELLAGTDGKPLPSWSLFIRFRSRRLWGLWPREGFTAWNRWWQQKCE